MKRRKWTNDQKTLIILSGLKGQPISEIFAEHGICQSQYYQWRDQFISNASKAFEAPKATRTEERLHRENKRLKGLVGELTLELKKSEEWE